MVTKKSWPQCGAYYIATGERFVREATASAMSVRKYMPELPIALASDCPGDPAHFDYHIPLESVRRSFIDKVIGLKLSPFERTLFLDTDTVLLTSLGDLFTVLDRFPLAVAAEPGRYFDRIDDIPDYFPEMNTGVLLFRHCIEFEYLLGRWQELYEAHLKERHAAGRPGHHDQPTFTQALYESGMPFFTLPPEWNFRAVFPQYAAGPVRIFHGRLKSPTADLALVNKSIYPRVFSPNPRRLPGIIADTFRLFRLLHR